MPVGGWACFDGGSGVQLPSRPPVYRPFALSWTRTGDTAHLVVRGEVDAATAPKLGAEMGAQLAGGVDRVHIDCRELDFIDSRGMGELLRWNSALQERGGGLSLSMPSPLIRESLSVLGLDRILTIVDT
jgi:anti-sigma B factor antagonist